MRRRVLAVVVVAILSTGATCQPRHSAVVSLQTLTSTLGALQDAEQVLWETGKLSPVRHRDFGVQMMKVWTLLNDAVTVTEAWQPGQPMPPQLRHLIESVRVILADATMIAGIDQAKVLAVYDAVSGILLAISGGAA